MLTVNNDPKMMEVKINCHISKTPEIELYLSSNNSEKNAEENSIGETFESLEEKAHKIIYHEIKPRERIIGKNVADQLSVSRMKYLKSLKKRSTCC